MKFLFGISQVALIAAFVVLYVRLAVGRAGLKATGQVWKDLPRRPVLQVAALIWLAVFLVDILQTQSDGLITAFLQVDYTPLFHQIEGGLPSALQAGVAFLPLTIILCLAYLILFPAILFGSALAYDRLDDMPRLRMTIYAYALNYLLCLPFYLFFPVTEPWAFSPAGVLPLMDTIHPWLLDILRPMSGINNCFPSFHVSLTVSLVLLAREGGPRAFSRTMTLSGCLIVISTIYLGFHWLTDLAAGVAAGCLVYAVARRLVVEQLPDTVPTRSRSGIRP